MTRLFFTGLVTFCVLFIGCAKRDKKDTAPSPPTLEQKLYGYWQLENSFEKASDVPRIPGVMKLSFNLNDLNQFDYCMADKSSNGMTGFSAANDQIEFQLPKLRDGDYMPLGQETIKFKITKLTPNELQLDGKYGYRRFLPADRNDVKLTPKVSPYCGAETAKLK